MDNTLDKKKEFIINVLYFALGAALVYFSVKYVLAWILPFIIGFFVALLLRPLIRFLSTKCRVPHIAAVIILAVIFYAVVGFLLILIGIKCVSILRDGFAGLPDIYTLYIEPLINNLFDKLETLTARLDPNMAHMVQNMTASFSESVGSVVSGISSQVITFLTSTVISLPGFLLSLLLSVISSIFFAMDLTKITNTLTNLLSENMRVNVARIKKLAANIGFKYVKSYAILLAVTFIELSVGFLLIGIDNAIAVAAIIALIDLMPILGTGLIVIPWLLIELIKGNYALGIELAVLYVVMVIVRNILEPKIVGRQIGVHPLAMLISMYVGLRIFGFIGIFILPLILVVIKGFYENKEKELE
ncbi:MAG: sporulation integral membrane protein YtvI [Clostridiales bacterium]|nr:sporulation integral membrane protein YtvI [Clostridiales bacterium]